MRGEYTEAARDPRVREHASLQLHDAEQSLLRLEAARRADAEEIAHLAYLTRQRLEIARMAAETGELGARVTELGTQRDQLRLRAREGDVSVARSEAEKNRADAEIARRVAASAISRARELEARIAELKAEQTERGLVITMSDVLFAFDSAQLLPGAERALGEVAALLNEYPDRRVSIEGHADGVGSDAYNQSLSQRRAQAVATALEARGVDRSRLTVRGFGDSMPVASNDEAAGRQANRRVDIVLANGPAPASGGS